MNKSIRKILFWIFFLLFFITASYIIFYSQGYRFDSVRKIFIHSGSITIKSTPANAAVFLNEVKQQTGALDIINSSVTINGLKPGSYKLRMSLEGYKDWVKSVEVHSGVSAEYWNVLLIPNDPEIKLVEATNPAYYFPSPFGKKIVYIVNNEGELQIWMSNLKTSQNTMLYSSREAVFSDNRKENIEWDFKEDLIACPIIKEGKKEYLVLSTDNKDFEPEFVSSFLPQNEIPLKARWSPSDEKLLYFISSKNEQESNSLKQFNTENGELRTIADNIYTYDISSRSIYILRENKVVFRTDLLGKNESQILPSPFTEEKIGDNSRLIVYDDNRFALISTNGELYLRNNGKEDVTKFLIDNCEGIQFSNDGKKMIFWNKNEINAIYLRDWDVQPRRVENEIQQIARFSSPIHNVAWHRDYEHIFYSSQGKLNMIELDGRDRRLSFSFIESNPEDFLGSYDAANGIFYFLDSIDGENKLYFFEFPKKTGFFSG